jgi:hypothetical protein
MIFASTPPHNTDPKPNINGHGTRVASPTLPGGYCSQCVTVYKPRPWFQPRAHDANPILVSFRESPGATPEERARDIRSWLYMIDSDSVGDEPPIHLEAHREHARRVLSRLAGWSA